MMKPGHEIYVASPLGFTEPGRRYWAEVLRPALLAAEVRPLDPWDEAIARSYEAARGQDGPERLRQLDSLNRSVGHRNAQMIERCVGVLAVLDGSDVDSGTAAEVGYAAGLGRPVVGLRTDFRLSGDNEATSVNLQVAYFVALGGGRVCASVDAATTLLLQLVSRGAGAIPTARPPA
jgi:nucleoside 2-deoxyribosyltransferase